MAISNDELQKGLTVIYDQWQELSEKTDWDEVQVLQQHGPSYVRITKHILNQQDFQTAVETEDEIEEDDDEALTAPTKATTTEPVVIYDIIHSPSYQVPVLYLALKNLASGPPPSIDELYQMLVPDSHRTSMQAVGQLGALTMTDHPVTGMPAYFVHPCRTREVMEPLLKDRRTSAEEYVMMWLGAIGASVGLNVPLPLARCLAQGKA